MSDKTAAIDSGEVMVPLYNAKYVGGDIEIVMQCC